MPFKDRGSARESAKFDGIPFKFSSKFWMNSDDSHFVKLHNFRHYGRKHSNCITNCLFKIEPFLPLGRKLRNLAKWENLYQMSFTDSRFGWSKTLTRKIKTIGPNLFFVFRQNGFYYADLLIFSSKPWQILLQN